MTSTNQENVVKDLAPAIPMTLGVKNDDGLAKPFRAEVLRGALQFNDIQAIYQAMELIRKNGFKSITLDISDSSFAWYQDASWIDSDNDRFKSEGPLGANVPDLLDASQESIEVFSGSFVIQCSPRHLQPLKVRSAHIPISALELKHEHYSDI